MKEKIKKLFDTNTTHGKIMRAVLVFLVIGAIVGIGYIILKVTGLWEKVNSMDKIREIVESGGIFSFLIFIFLQILQTTVLQIPAMFVTIVGAWIFGTWQAFLLSYISIMIGSIIMFWIGRKAGRRFLNWIIGKESSEKWIDRMSKGKYLFFLMMVFPMFPDDILCVVAGLTNMSFPFFLITNLIARGIGVATTVWFGSGAIIPYHGWGLIVWGLLILFVLALFYISVKYKDKIDAIISAMFKRKGDKPIGEEPVILSLSESMDNNVSKENFDKNVNNNDKNPEKIQKMVKKE